MGSAGEAIYLVVSRLMGSPASNLAQSVLNALQSLVLFALLLAYHFRLLRRDGRLAEQALSERHQAYPVLVIQPGTSGFGDEIVLALQQTAPNIPVTVQVLKEDRILLEMPAVKAVILPSSLATHPPDGLRTWLADFPGERLVVPVTEESWQWIGAAAKTGRERAQQAAHVIRQMAEGQPVRIAPPATAWTIAGYVLAGLFTLQMALVLTAIVVSLLQR